MLVNEKLKGFLLCLISLILIIGVGIIMSKDMTKSIEEKTSISE